MARGPGILRTLYLMNRAKQVSGKIKNTVGDGVGLAREGIEKLRRREIIAQGEQQSFERRNAQRISEKARKKELAEIEEKLARAMRTSLKRLRTDSRMRAMARIIYEIFGRNISAQEIQAVNQILAQNLHKGAPLLKQSPALRTAVGRISFGKAKSKDFQVLIQASMDILQNHETGQQILQNKGLI